MHAKRGNGGGGGRGEARRFDGLPVFVVIVSEQWLKRLSLDRIIHASHASPPRLCTVVCTTTHCCQRIQPSTLGADML